MKDERLPTYGDHLVGRTFNPSGNGKVDYIKERAANLIDYVRSNGQDDRCTALAITALEEAAMWAVKSITKPPMAQ